MLSAVRLYPVHALRDRDVPRDGTLLLEVRAVGNLVREDIGAAEGGRSLPPPPGRGVPLRVREGARLTVQRAPAGNADIRLPERVDER